LQQETCTVDYIP